MNKPEPTRELVIEPSDHCERCLTLYAISEPARAFIKKECECFGILKPLDTQNDGRSLLSMLVKGAPSQPPATTEVVYTLHVWPNYDKDQVRSWLESWPHISEPFEQAIEAMQ